MFDQIAQLFCTLLDTRLKRCIPVFGNAVLLLKVLDQFLILVFQHEGFEKDRVVIAMGHQHHKQEHQHQSSEDVTRILHYHQDHCRRQQQRTEIKSPDQKHRGENAGRTTSHTSDDDHGQELAFATYGGNYGQSDDRP